MIKRFLFLLLSLIFLTGCPVSTTYMVSMKDGVELATDVKLPPEGEGPWPVLLIRTPYGKKRNFSLLDYLNDYVFVIQDVRGRHDSEGEYFPFFDDGWGEKQDGYNTTEWILDQSWSNGKIGTYGASADGILQHQLAGAAPPGLACQFILVAPTDLYSQLIFQGGVFRHSLVTLWLEKQNAAHWLDTIKEHPLYDSFWESGNVETRTEIVKAPAFHIGGWYDVALKGTINGFLTRQVEGAAGAKGNQKLIIGPWTHGGIVRTLQGQLLYPANSLLDWDEQISNWHSYWLKGEATGSMDEAPVRYYVMGDTSDPGAPGNLWRDAETWPPYDLTPVSYYLHSGGVLSADTPENDEAFSTYSFNPENPVPTYGGANLSIPAGPYDQRIIESRHDVALFSTAPLEQTLEVTGDLKVVLYISSDVVDTDFTAKLTDVYPDGRSMLIADGIIRTRFRNNSFTSSEMMVPGTIYRLEIDIWAASIIFNKGHRIRLALSSSNYPRFDVNPNTGGDPFNKETMVTATNTVYYNKSYPSHILLPIVDP
jgi:predicted acyl esterase